MGWCLGNDVEVAGGEAHPYGASSVDVRAFMTKGLGQRPSTLAAKARSRAGELLPRTTHISSGSWRR